MDERSIEVVSGGGSGAAPFAHTGVVRTDQGWLAYEGLPETLLSMFRTSVDAFGDRECWSLLGGESLTYREAWRRSAEVAGGLISSGLQTGDRVAITFPNGIEWCVSFWGTLLAGGVAVPVNTRFSESEVDYVICDSGALVVLGPNAPIPVGDPYVTGSSTAGDPAGIFYTSGTTGAPKGAVLSHENFLSNIENCIRTIGIERDEPLRNLISVPLFHVTGCNSQLLLMMQTGGVSVIMAAFKAAPFIRAVSQERINLLTAVPAIYWLALNDPTFEQADTSHVRWVTYGGAPVTPATVRALRGAFPGAALGNGFGMTETSSLATYLPDGFADEMPESVGFPVPTMELALGSTHKEPGVGELLMRGQNVIGEYWRRPEATAEALRDGWLHSGDVARISADGSLEIVDRIKDMINRGGENVYCVEVEAALAAHPAVFEVAVLAVPDDALGEKVGAVIVAHEGTTIDKPELQAFAREHLADFKVPEYVAVGAEPLPRNPAGKVLKGDLSEDAQWM